MDRKRGGPVPLRDWGPKREAKARGRGLTLLAGVGTGPSLWSEGGVVIHLRRRLADEELARLEPAWLAIPAVDAG